MARQKFASRKSIRKNIQKMKKFESVGEWARPFANQLFWSCYLQWNWNSLMGHIQNIHSGQDNTLPLCAHYPLLALQLSDLVWYTSVFRLIMLFEDTVLDYVTLPEGSEFCWALQVESYYSIYYPFTPKMYQFSF